MAKNSPFANSVTFKSLSEKNYFHWFWGALFSNIGIWIQRTVQTWIVISVIDYGSATSLSTIMLLQYLPQIFFTTLSAKIVQRVRTSKLLIWMQLSFSLVGVILLVLIYTNNHTLFAVQMISLAFGVLTSIESPARQVFVSQLVNKDNVANAVSLNSVSWNIARIIAPAFTGLMIGLSGYCVTLLFNIATYIFAAIMVITMDKDCFYEMEGFKTHDRKTYKETLKYLWSKKDHILVITLVFVVSGLGGDFDIFISKLSLDQFGQDSSEHYGFLSLAIAVGALAGGLLSARRKKPSVRAITFFTSLSGISLVFLAGFAILATYNSFGMVFCVITLIILGYSISSMLSTSMMYIQTKTSEKFLVVSIALYLAIFFGARPVTAPFVGWLDDTYSNPIAILVSGLIIFAFAIYALIKKRKYLTKKNLITFFRADNLISSSSSKISKKELKSVTIKNVKSSSNGKEKTTK